MGHDQALGQRPQRQPAAKPVRLMLLACWHLQVVCTPEGTDEGCVRESGFMKRSWWQTGRSPRFGFAMGGAYLIIGLGGLALTAFGGMSPWWWAVSSGWLVLAAFYLSSAVAMKRHANSAGRGGSNGHRSSPSAR